MPNFNIRFPHGTVTAADPMGPELGGNGATGLFAYNTLGRLRGLVGRDLIRPNHWHRPRRRRGLEGVVQWLEWWRFFHFRKTFMDITLTMVGEWELDIGQSRFPRGGQQEEVYDGDLKLSWARTRGMILWNGPGGDTTIRGRIRLTFPLAENVAIAIAGTGTGTMQPPLDEAEAEVTATFGSVFPEDYGGSALEFEVNDFVLRGAWNF